MGGASNCSHLYLYDISGTQERSSQPSLTNLTLALHATAPQPLQNLQNLHLKTVVRGAMRWSGVRRRPGEGEVHGSQQQMESNMVPNIH